MCWYETFSRTVYMKRNIMDVVKMQKIILNRTDILAQQMQYGREQFLCLMNFGNTKSCIWNGMREESKLYNVKNNLPLLIHKAFVFSSANPLWCEIVGIGHKFSNQIRRLTLLRKNNTTVSFQHTSLALYIATKTELQENVGGVCSWAPLLRFKFEN
jgi:hypothetical protein